MHIFCLKTKVLMLSSQVFMSGKLDARPQVITNSGQVKGELQILLLLEGKVKKDKKDKTGAQVSSPLLWCAKHPARNSESWSASLLSCHSLDCHS